MAGAVPPWVPWRARVDGTLIKDYRRFFRKIHNAIRDNDKLDHLSLTSFRPNDKTCRPKGALYVLQKNCPPTRRRFDADERVSE